MSMVQVMEMAAPAIDEKEILRYAQCREADENTLMLLRECIREAEGVLCWRVCWKRVSCEADERECRFAGFTVPSRDLAKNLQGCREVILFAATVGMGMDRLIAKYQRLSPAKAVMMQAVGAERAEALCDAFCAWLEGQGMKLRPRFSPGYGDVSLHVQKEFFALLQCEKHLGVYLNQSLLMSPSKSVTAFAGLE